MIHELDIETFVRLVARKINELNNREVVLKDPTDKSIFPCTVIRTPYENQKINEGTIPVYTRFQISIEEWAQSKYDVLRQSYETAKKLREYNFKKTGNEQIIYDEITNKNRLISNYEVNYNGLTNSFERIK